MAGAAFFMRYGGRRMRRHTVPHTGQARIHELII